MLSGYLVESASHQRSEPVQLGGNLEPYISINPANREGKHGIEVGISVERKGKQIPHGERGRKEPCVLGLRIERCECQTATDLSESHHGSVG